MGILGFGRATKLENLKVNDLKKERLDVFFLYFYPCI